MHPEITRIHLNLYRQAGYSLLELVLVVLVLGILAAVMIPNLSSGNETALELAARQYAEAIRFARSESMRQAELFAFKVRTDQDFIKVKTVDTSTSPWSMVWNVHHPLRKTLYKIDLKAQAATRNISTGIVSRFHGNCTAGNKIYFNRFGQAFCLDPDDIRVISYEIRLSLNGQKRSVLLDGQTGRVTVR